MSSKCWSLIWELYSHVVVVWVQQQWNRDVLQLSAEMNPASRNRKMSSECERCMNMDTCWQDLHWDTCIFLCMYHISSHMIRQRKEMSCHSARSPIKYSLDGVDLPPSMLESFRWVTEGHQHMESSVTFQKHLCGTVVSGLGKGSGHHSVKHMHDVWICIDLTFLSACYSGCFQVNIAITFRLQSSKGPVCRISSTLAADCIQLKTTPRDNIMLWTPSRDIAENMADPLPPWIQKAHFKARKPQ